MKAAGSGLSAKPLNTKIGQVLTPLVAIGQCYSINYKKINFAGVFGCDPTRRLSRRPYVMEAAGPAGLLAKATKRRNRY